MKKTLAILLVIAFALTLGIVVLAEGLSEEEVLPAEETESVVEAETVAEEPAAEEAAEEAPAEEAPAAEEPAEETAEETPAEEAPADEEEDAAFVAWMAQLASLDPSYDISEAEWRLCYVLNHRIQSWYCSEIDELPAEIAEAYGTTNEEELPWIIKYTSIGEKDSTETLDVYYYGTDENGNACEKTETITIAIPAGETVFYVMDPGFKVERGGFSIIAGSYGDRYEAMPEA